MFNLPVFWPILLVYFVVLLAITLRTQIAHMIRYRYKIHSHLSVTVLYASAQAGMSHSIGVKQNLMALDVLEQSGKIRKLPRTLG